MTLLFPLILGSLTAGATNGSCVNQLKLLANPRPITTQTRDVDMVGSLKLFLGDKDYAIAHAPRVDTVTFKIRRRTSSRTPYFFEMIWRKGPAITTRVRLERRDSALGPVQLGVHRIIDGFQAHLSPDLRALAAIEDDRSLGMKPRHAILFIFSSAGQLELIQLTTYEPQIVGDLQKSQTTLAVRPPD